jgi:hypothetical protein
MGGIPVVPWSAAWLPITTGTGTSTPACDAFCAPRAGSDLGDGWCSCTGLACDPCAPARADSSFTVCPAGTTCGGLNGSRCTPAGPVMAGDSCGGSDAPERQCAPALECNAGTCLAACP